MDFSIHDQDIGRSVVHVEEQEQVTEINVAKSDDTSFKEQVMEDAIEVIPTTHHSHVSIEETVLNKKADDAIYVAPQSDTKGLSGDEHGVDTLQQNLEKARFKSSSC